MEAQLYFCETAVSGGIELFNTLSCIAYIAVGVIVLYQTISKSRHNARLIALGVLTVVLGVASMSLHITKSQVGLLLDVSAMLIWILYVTTFFFIPMSTTLKLIIYIISISIVIGGFVLSNVLIPLIPFVVLGITSLFVQLRLHPEIKDSQYFIIGLITLIAGLFFWQADAHNVYCIPELVFINGHVIWHLATAIVIWCAYKLIVKFDNEE